MIRSMSENSPVIPVKSVIISVPVKGKRREYTIKADESMSVLDALETIRQFQEPDLIYRHSCHHGSCGTCACLINGREALACTTRVLAVEGEAVRLEPLKGMAALSGLVFDSKTVVKDISPHWLYKRRSELGGERFENCIECGACLSACPPYSDGGSFVGPAALAALNRERQNNPASAYALLAKADCEAWARGCKRAINCSRVCPAEVAPAKKIQELRNEIGGA
jgi:succinate dehydrogenase iron-sulfur subunit